MSEPKRKVAYYYDADVGAYTYGLGHPMKPHRIRVTHDLVSAYGMLEKMHVLKPERATPEVMSSFHTDEYVNFLHTVTPETVERMTAHGTRFLVGEDNPGFEGLFEFCSISAGGSIGAAHRITSGAADIAINWAGGLHHAKKREASGFCYINDIVLGILELLRTFPRVLYIDIDCHHGDGVEEAFYTTDRVMTCSFHKFGEYFPGTGTQEDVGRGRGKGYAVNVPLKDGVTDESYESVFQPIVSKILEVFRPSAVVLQCGSDSLAGDKLGCFNLTMHGHAACAQFIRKQNLPLIMLGGGGYTVKNVARTWAYETACALGIEQEIDLNLPWNEYFEWFGPRYRLEVMRNNMEDLNVGKEGMGTLQMVRERAMEQLRELGGAPSVQMGDVPRESVRQHLGFGRDEEGDNEDEEDGDRMRAWKREEAPRRDVLDETLAKHVRYVYNLQESVHLQSSSSSSSSSSLSSLSSDDEDDDEVEMEATYPQSVLNRHAGTRGRRRMSLLTGRYFDVPDEPPSYSGHADGEGRKRRFFFAGPWDNENGNDVDGKVRLRMGVADGIHGTGQQVGESRNRNVYSELDKDGMEVDM